MEFFNSLSVLAGGSWASGVNMYLTMAGLGIAHRMHWLTLPGDLKVISHPILIILAVFLYLVEFVADKIPYVDSVWDAAHTFIRPLGGALLGFLATAGAGPLLQTGVGILTGAVSLQSHLAKATTRLAINTSPEPLSNSVASVTEDVTVGTVLYLIVQHPIIASLVIVGLIAFTFWLLKKMFRFARKVFRFMIPQQAEVRA